MRYGRAQLSPAACPVALRIMFILALNLFLAATITSPGEGTSTIFWVAEGRGEFMEGTTEGTAVDYDGQVVLAPERHLVSSTAETYLWDLARDERGNVYLATGSEGKILEWSRDQGTRTLFALEGEPEVFAITYVSGEGLYAGCSPTGVLLRLSPGDEPDTVARWEGGFIWDLLAAPNGDLYAATGTPGVIYKLARGERRPEVFFRAEDEHVVSLTWHPDGRILAGTGGKGLAYSIEMNGAGRVLYDARQEEVRALVVDDEGRVFVGATGDDEEGEEKSGEQTPKPAVYRINPSGIVEKVWSCPEDVLYSLVIDRRGDLLVGTGDRGKVFRLPRDDSRYGAQIATMTEGQVISLLTDPEGVLIGTGNPAVLYRLGPDLEQEGSFTSRVYDAGQICGWGTLAWELDQPRGTGAELECRSGNTMDPGEGWSTWTEVDGEAKSGAIESPPGRYLQWRARLSGKENESPRLIRVRTSYLPPNLAPRIHRLSVSPSGAPLSSSPPGAPPPTLHQILPSGVEVEFSVRQSSNLTQMEVEPWARALRTAEWEATDANEDPLVYRLDYRSTDDTSWTLLAEEVEGPAYTWNTASFPDGLYQLRVVADDRLGNPRGRNLTTERVSRSFVVDNTPPRITRLRLRRSDTGEFLLEGAAEDGSGTLVGASFALNGGDWETAVPIDGIVDESKEEFSQILPGLEEDTHTLVLKVIDEGGNSTVRRTVFNP